VSKFAVYLDYQRHGDFGVTSVPLGGFPRNEEKFWVEVTLGHMIGGPDGEPRDMWEVPERDLPHDYQFMTYYVAGYDEG